MPWWRSILAVEAVRHDDMLRTDFAPEWEATPKDAKERLEDNTEVLHKHLVHLTWARIQQDDSSPAEQYMGLFGSIHGSGGAGSGGGLMR
jgi:hypothetical protein